jgi:uncharacterized protein with HEPN domain
MLRSEMSEFEKDQARRLDMIRAADTIRGYLRGITRAKFMGMALDAVLRQLGIFGEAAAEFTLAARRQYPSIAWGSIVAMRQYVIHQYFNVDLDEAWDAATQAAPEYARALRAKDLKKPSAQLEAELDLMLKHKRVNKRGRHKPR